MWFLVPPTLSISPVVYLRLNVCVISHVALRSLFSFCVPKPDFVSNRFHFPVRFQSICTYTSVYRCVYMYVRYASPCTKINICMYLCMYVRIYVCMYIRCMYYIYIMSYLRIHIAPLKQNSLIRSALSLKPRRKQKVLRQREEIKGSPVKVLQWLALGISLQNITLERCNAVVFTLITQQPSSGFEDRLQAIPEILRRANQQTVTPIDL